MKKFLGFIWCLFMMVFSVTVIMAQEEVLQTLETSGYDSIFGPTSPYRIRFPRSRAEVYPVDITFTFNNSLHANRAVWTRYIVPNIASSRPPQNWGDVE